MKSSALNLAQLIGQCIKDSRLGRNLSQEQMATISGLDRTHISLIESGKTTITLSTLSKILESLGDAPSFFQDISERLRSSQDQTIRTHETPPVALIVEDEAITAESLRIQLEELGYQTIGPISQCDLAHKIAIQSKPALAVLDIKLRSKNDGIQLAEKIRQSVPGCRLVFLTAYSDEDTLQRAQAVAPDGYLLKPFTEQQLLAVIKTL